MTRVHIACEGPTELAFVREVLQPELPRLHLIPYLPGKLISRRGRGRGGDIRYERVKMDFTRALKNDPASVCTTLFDYYALGTDFPQHATPHGSDPDAKARRIEAAVEADIATRMGKNFNSGRFRCFLVMHEFEGLLFSAPRSLANGLGRPGLSAELQAIRGTFPSPEHINDSPGTAPSKRLLALCPDYDKVIGGNVAALAVGIDAIRGECAHFRAWIEWLESLA